jgi:hypothetical protein
VSDRGDFVEVLPAASSRQTVNRSVHRLQQKETSDQLAMKLARRRDTSICEALSPQRLSSYPENIEQEKARCDLPSPPS